MQGCPCSPSPSPACSPSLPFLPEFMALRLENGTNCSGRLQVFYNGTWGSVCSNSMTPETVSLACKELGCGDRGSLETQRPYGRLSGTAWLDRVECGERNSSFWQCPSAPWHPQSCDDLREETHITCKGNSELAGHQHPLRSCSWLGMVKFLGLQGPFVSKPDAAAAGTKNGTSSPGAPHIHQRLPAGLPASPG